MWPCSIYEQPCIKSCSDEARDETNEHAPAGLDEVIFLLVIGLVHVLGAGQSHGLHVGEEYPVEEDAVVPVNKQPYPVTHTQC